MPVPFIMPKFDMDQERAKIASWEKHEGESVRADEVVLVVETDKVAIEVTAPATGTLAGIRYQPGDDVPVTTVIAYILKPGETAADLPGAVTAGPAATPVAKRAAQDLGVELARVPAAGKRVTRQDVERYAAGQPQPVADVSAAAGPGAGGDRAPGRVTSAATPAARRAARELGLPLEQLSGSGPRGRIQAADVRAAAQPQPPAALAAWAERSAEVVALEGMRKTIADRMQASFHEAPHIALTIEVDAGELDASRARLAAMAARDGLGSVSLTALLVKCVAWALARHPDLNASLRDGLLYRWRDVNVGVAMALDNGLIVPVIHQANVKAVREIAVALHDLTERAREGRLRLADVQHGTFTISNLGMFGIQQFRAIINPPESAILAVGKVIRKPVVINAQDEVAVRPIMALTLSADHRVIDGVVAARFLADVAQVIAAPDTLLY
jgi:pyruvate dehydrogenase E2 component (dihydrolipoamide acetyltransferase)